MTRSNSTNASECLLSILFQQETQKAESVSAQVDWEPWSVAGWCVLAAHAGKLFDLKPTSCPRAGVFLHLTFELITHFEHVYSYTQQGRIIVVGSIYRCVQSSIAGLPISPCGLICSAQRAYLFSSRLQRERFDNSNEIMACSPKDESAADAALINCGLNFRGGPAMIVSEPGWSSCPRPQPQPTRAHIQRASNSRWPYFLSLAFTSFYSCLSPYRRDTHRTRPPDAHHPQQPWQHPRTRANLTITSRT